jgi:hypothetical protein
MFLGETARQEHRTGQRAGERLVLLADVDQDPAVELLAQRLAGDLRDARLCVANELVVGPLHGGIYTSPSPRMLGSAP